MKTRPFESSDVPALQIAIDADTFHPGEWEIEYFTHPSVYAEVIEDSKGPVVYTLFTRESKEQLRISCVWVDGADISRNARAVIFGVKDAVVKARSSKYTEILIESGYPPLRTFLERALGFIPKPGTKDMGLKTRIYE